MIGDLISAGAKLIGGFADRSAAKDLNAQKMFLAEQEAARQREFAQMGIQWRVKDAEAAGVHPLFALGASTASYAPQSIGALEKTSLGSALSDMGQDVGRAVAATSTPSDRTGQVARDAIILEGLKLDNDIKRARLASDVARLAAPAVGPPFPEASPAKRAVGHLAGEKIYTDPNTTNVEDFWQKRYGEPGEWVGAPLVGLMDLKENVGRWTAAKAEQLMKLIGPYMSRR